MGLTNLREYGIVRLTVIFVRIGLKEVIMNLVYTQIKEEKQIFFLFISILMHDLFQAK